MTVSREERNRILDMVAAGQVSVEEAGQLFDALQEEPPAFPPQPLPNRTVRVWITDMAAHNRQVNMTVTLPVNVLRITLQALASVIPPLRDKRVEQVIRSVESGMTGRVMDLQDLEDGKRVEIFIEQ